MENNVIKFPKTNLNNTAIPLITIENVDHNVEMMRQYHIQETIITLAPIIFNQLEIAGFQLPDDSSKDIKDGAFVIEAIRSIMCKHYNIYHPFQQLADSVFVRDPTDENAYTIAENINIELKRV